MLQSLWVPRQVLAGQGSSHVDPLRRVLPTGGHRLCKNVQTTNILDIVYYEDHPSLPSCASIAAPRPQNI